MPARSRKTWSMALAALVVAVLPCVLAGCPGQLPERGDQGSGGGGDLMPGNAGGPCFADNTCYSGLSCSNGVCVSTGSPDWGGSTPDGLVTDGSTLTPDSYVAVPDMPPWTPDKQVTTSGGFGAKCHSASPCAAGLTCVAIGQSAAAGFCTKTCPASAKTCSGGPAGTQPACILSDKKGNHYCVFICKTGTASYPCPKTLTCSTSANPPGSGQHVCI